MAAVSTNNNHSNIITKLQQDIPSSEKAIQDMVINSVQVDPYEKGADHPSSTSNNDGAFAPEEDDTESKTASTCNNLQTKLDNLEGEIKILQNIVHQGEGRLKDANDHISELRQELLEERKLRKQLQERLKLSDSPNKTSSVKKIPMALPPELESEATPFQDLEEMADLVQGMLRVYEQRVSQCSPTATSKPKSLDLVVHPILNKRSATKEFFPRRNSSSSQASPSKPESGNQGNGIIVKKRRSSISKKNVGNLSTQSVIVHRRKSRSKIKPKIQRRLLKKLNPCENLKNMAETFIHLGPQQHSMMLRQLRYIKSVMHELPWAKCRLRSMLTLYTKKEITKEEMYPQLSHLNSQVMNELSEKSRVQKEHFVKRSKRTIDLSIAQNVINDSIVTKYGRRGKPHQTRLIYESKYPQKLHWLSKNGEKSIDYLQLSTIENIELGCLTQVLKKATKKEKNLQEECCLSLIAAERTLDLRLKNSMHRDWLLKALHQAIDFAKESAGSDHRKRGLRRM